MIAIATNNGHKFLPELIESLETYGTDGHDVLIVDTGSSDPAATEYLGALESYNGPFKLMVTQTPYKGYDTGAYLWAFRNFPADTYIFMQDSVLVKQPGWTKEFESRLSFGVGAVPWLTFPLQWDSEEQVGFVTEKFQTTDLAPFGVFGPMFATTHDALSDLESQGLLNVIPSNKHEQQAMERGWAFAFIKGGYGVRPIHSAFSADRIRHNQYSTLTKRLPKRA
ncbi:MAG: hypothetical protein KF784_06385 [Fimbriimonadaceae bacterium]|nr:hypothetical protein [Fimbriimonadaceae bacterium]